LGCKISGRVINYLTYSLPKLTVTDFIEIHGSACIDLVNLNILILSLYKCAMYTARAERIFVQQQTLDMLYARPLTVCELIFFT
jgi:hypothetical protein